MKNLIIVLGAIILMSACNNGNKKISDEKSDIKSMNDSIVQLIISFQQNQDSVALKSALLLNDKVIALDTANNNQFYNLNTRIQILGLLNREKEAFLLREKLLSKDKLDIDRLMYYGQKYKLEGQIDSSQVYFNEAINQCDKLLSDTLNADLVIKKAKIYIYQNKNDAAINEINLALLRDPENEVLRTFKEDFDEYCKMMSDLFQKLH